MKAIRQKNLFKLASLAILIVAGSCTSGSVIDDIDPNSVELQGVGSVRVKFDGIAVASGSRAAGEIQTADEKKVTSIYAVVFNDLDAAVENGTESAATDDDTFYGVYNVLALNGESELDPTKEYIFKIEQLGHYHVCFVANPSSDLLAKINALQTGVSKVSAFKKLEESQDPATKPMLMTSTFHGIKLALAESYIGVVKLQRIMSRIDIINQTKGLTVDNITFKGRTTKSLLINDNYAHNTSYVETEKKYDGLNLPGSLEENATTNKYEAEIYSYEHYANGVSNPVPSMAIVYHLDTAPNAKYKHEVSFVDENGNAITFERNHRYRIYIRYGGDQIFVFARATPWNEAEEWVYDDVQLMDGLQGEAGAEVQ